MTTADMWELGIQYQQMEGEKGAFAIKSNY